MLAKAISRCQSLKLCHSSNNKMGALTAKEMARAIETSKVLRDLDLSNNLIIMEEL